MVSLTVLAWLSSQRLETGFVDSVLLLVNNNNYYYVCLECVLMVGGGGGGGGVQSGCLTMDQTVQLVVSCTSRWCSPEGSITTEISYTSSRNHEVML